MLMAAGLPLPTHVVVHGYITASGQKISKSLGNSVDPANLFARYGIAAVRYMLLADFSPFSDGDFSEDRLVARYNTDLANGLGNLVSRATSMTLRYRDGIVPDLTTKLGAAEESLAEQLATSIDGSIEAMAGFDHKLALHRIWDLVRRANAYVDERAPWKLAKAAEAGDQAASAALDMTLMHLIGVVEQLGALLRPFLPAHADIILRSAGAPPNRIPDAHDWLDGIAGRQVTKPPPLFPKLDPVEP
jgi:methionyl-tRNA synthetase